MNEMEQKNGRVKKWRGGLGRAYLFAGCFVCRCLASPTGLGFPFPARLILAGGFAASVSRWLGNDRPE